MAITFLTEAGLSVSEFSRELVGDDYGVPACVIFVDAAPGEGPRLHRHPYAELFFTLEGEATFTDGETVRTVGAGSVVIVPPDHPHAFVNAGAGRLRQIDVHLSSAFRTTWLG
jgi:mannose-6-phosphate isomerase-like protein (cupin superfamily)